MSFTATVTAKTGPAQQVTAAVLTGITAFSVNADKKILQLFQGSDLTSAPYKEFELSGNTFTITIALGNITAMVVS
jgi:hypothetical protein